MSSAKESISRPSSDAPLAAAIYVELVGRAFLRTDNAASIKPDAAVLATLSFELAAAFRKAEKAAGLGPQNVGYNVQLTDLAGWDK